MLKKLWYISKSNDMVLKMLSRIYNTIMFNRKKLKGKNNLINVSGAFIKNSRIFVAGNNNRILCEDGVRLVNCRFHILGDNHQIIIKKGCYGINSTFWIEDNNCSISVGSKTTMEGIGVSVTEPFSCINIGSDCMFSAGIDIRNGDSHSIIDINTNRRINYAKDINIEDHVWIGRDVKILKGVRIGSNSVIAANAIVTSNIPENHIAAGIPARIVKENITWDRKRIYE
ncbi:acyltransferase [Bacillus sp. JJ864]|uniref:acyltransferase n=1 Tax=Bacillus sp. JJ864 TaxID=3122975 RepID=UPI003000D9F5